MSWGWHFLSWFCNYSYSLRVWKLVNIFTAQFHYLREIFSHSWLFSQHHIHTLASKSLCSHAALPPSLHLLFLATSCFSTSQLFTVLPLLLFTLPQHSFSTSSVIQGVESGGGGSLLWSDSYKILISTRNMIAREKGGWNVENGRNWEKNIPWIKLCLRNAYFQPLLCDTWFSSS